MKLKKGFILRSVAGRAVVITDNEMLDMNKMITLNDTGRFLWEILEKGAEKQELISALIAEYEVDEEKASEDVENFVVQLKKYEILDEC